MKNDSIAKILKERYTAEDAKQEIDGILSTVAPTCRIEFRRTDAEITDSYLVRRSRTRRQICEILARTELTDRRGSNLSSEWRVHNLAWYLHVFRQQAKDVSLDYSPDRRWTVRLATAVFEKLRLF